MLIQQKYQTMYFDNYVKSNPSTLNHKFDQSSVSVFHQQSLNPFEPIQFNQKAYFNPRLGENTSNPSPGVNKNNEQQPKQYVAYQTGPTHPHIQRQQSFQIKNNILFNNEPPNSINNRETGEFMRRRDSITQNTFLRSNHGHSPSNNKSHVTENGGKNSLRMVINNQQHRSMQQGQKSNGSFHNISNLTGTGFSDQDYGMNSLLNKDQNEKILEKTQDKTGYFKSSNYSQYGFSQSRVGSKPYALGFKSGTQNLDIDSRKASQPYGKQKPLQEKQLMYNYQLKNTSSQLTSFSKPGTMTQDDYKYYTPSLMKKSSIKDDSGMLGKNGFSQLVDVRHHNNMLEREGNNPRENNNLTDRQLHKSPSFDALLIGNGNKDQFRTKLQSTLESNCQHHEATSNQFTSQTNCKQSSQQNITPRNHTSNTVIDNQPYTAGNKTSSQSFILDPMPQKISKQSTKNYHALIQNLEKKFSQQKKSSETFQNKEKTYLAQMNKKDDKIKRLEIIIENNKETISALDQTIKQLRRQNQTFKDQTLSKAQTANTNNLNIIDELKRENGGLKQELKKQRKKSMSTAEQNFQKQIFERQQVKIKQLQKTLIQANNQRQNISQQFTKLKDVNSSIQEKYFQQIKEHQKIKDQLKQLHKIKQELKEYQRTKDQLQRTKQQIQQLNYNYKEKFQSFNQVKSMLQNLQNKYEGSLKKILTQEEEFDQECKKLKERIETQRKDKQSLVEETQNLRAKVERLTKEIDFKSMKIKSSEDKISEKQAQLQATLSAHHKAIFSNENSVNETISICIEETRIAKQKLSLQQQAYQNLNLELSGKNRQIEQLIKDNASYKHKISYLEFQLNQLGLKVAQNESKIGQNPKNTSDSAQIKTISSECGKDSPQMRQIQSLLELYHQKYTDIVTLFSLNQPSQQKSANQQSEPLTSTHIQNSEGIEHNSKPHPSHQYLNQYHPLLTDQVKKVLKDMKKLLNVLKECQADSQLKTQRLQELDKTFKKQVNKINQLLGEIHLKNMTIIEINHMQVEKDVFRLNQKYEILNNVGLGEA